MRQIIPFKKELMLPTKIFEVTSISLEHTLSLADDNVVKGDFIVSGDYKMTASSINREKFNFKLPVEIDMDDSYDYKEATVDIENFYYEIVNDDAIKVNIDVYVEAKKVENNFKDQGVVIDNSINDVIENEDIDRVDVDFSDDKDTFDNLNDDSLISDIASPSVSFKQSENVDLEKVINDEVVEDNNINFFNTDSFSTDTYTTYYVYIVKKDDTIDKILEMFNTTKEDLSIYNSIEDIKKGTKLIIPATNE